MSFTLDIRTAEEIEAAQLSADQNSALRRIVAALDEAAGFATNDVPLAEQLSWTRKADAAEAYLAGTATPAQTAMLGAEAAEADVAVDALAQTIADNASAYAMLAARLAGLRQKYRDRVQAAATPDELHAALADFHDELEAWPKKPEE